MAVHFDPSGCNCGADCLRTVSRVSLPTAPSAASSPAFEHLQSMYVWNLARIVQTKTVLLTRRLRTGLENSTLLARCWRTRRSWFLLLRTACRRLARSVAASAKDRPSASRSCLQRLPSRRTSHSIAQVSLTRWTLREVRPAAPVTAAHAGTASCAARTLAAGLGTR